MVAENGGIRIRECVAADIGMGPRESDQRSWAAASAAINDGVTTGCREGCVQQ